MQNTCRICISSPPDRNKLVAEIFFDEIQWAEINQEYDLFEIEFYSRPDKQPWRIDFTKVLQALHEGKQRLMQINQ